MRKNVFWLDHDNMEEGANEDVHLKSHNNLWEVDFTLALVRHIVRQGVYRSSDIAVLTPYTGQLQKLRAKMRSDFEIVLSERDEDLLAKGGFNKEEANIESQRSESFTSAGIHYGLTSEPEGRKMWKERSACVDAGCIASLDIT
jgi:hypothetical protein